MYFLVLLKHAKVPVLDSVNFYCTCITFKIYKIYKSNNQTKEKNVLQRDECMPPAMTINELDQTGGFKYETNQVED